MWLKIDGCEGEANDDGHQKEIDIESYSWGLHHPVNFHGGGLSSGETTVSELTVTKHIDKSSPNLMKFCLNAKSLRRSMKSAPFAGGHLHPELLPWADAALRG